MSPVDRQQPQANLKTFHGLSGCRQKHPIVLFPDTPLSRLQVNVSTGFNGSSGASLSCPGNVSFLTTLGEPSQ